MNGRTETIRVFVYGTLRVGEPYHHLLSACEYEGQHTTAPLYEQIDLGNYPGLIQNGSTAVIGDIYIVDIATLTQLDEYEGYPEYYLRKPIELSDGTTAIAYIYIKDTSSFTHIQSGNWQNR